MTPQDIQSVDVDGNVTISLAPKIIPLTDLEARVVSLQEIFNKKNAELAEIQTKITEAQALVDAAILLRP